MDNNTTTLQTEKLITLNTLKEFKDKSDEILDNLVNDLIEDRIVPLEDKRIDNLYDYVPNNETGTKEAYSVAQTAPQDHKNSVLATSAVALGVDSVAGSKMFKINIANSKNGEEAGTIIVALEVEAPEAGKTDEYLNMLQASKQHVTIIVRNFHVYTLCGVIKENTAIRGITDDTKNLIFVTIVPSPNLQGNGPLFLDEKGIDLKEDEEKKQISYLKVHDSQFLGNIQEDEGNMAIGNRCKASDKCSFAGGYESFADSGYGIAYGFSNHAGYAGNAFGKNNYATGNFASAENFGNKALAEKSHAEGNNNIIGYTALGSHVEGGANSIRAKAGIAYTDAIKSNKGYSHVEGYSNTDEGFYSHIENQGNHISENVAQAHAGGFLTTIGKSGHRAFAHGFGLHADTTDLTLVGSVNKRNGAEQTSAPIYNLSGNPRFVVGNGTRETIKGADGKTIYEFHGSNAFEVNDAGNVYIQKDGYIGGTSDNNKIVIKSVLDSNVTTINNTINTNVTTINGKINKINEKLDTIEGNLPKGTAANQFLIWDNENEKWVAQTITVGGDF